MALNIKRVIQEYHLSGKVVADRMGVTPAALSQFINGNPSAAILENIAQAIGCEVGEFFGTVQRPWFRCPHCQQKIYVDRVEYGNGLLTDVVNEHKIDDSNACAVNFITRK